MKLAGNNPIARIFSFGPTALQQGTNKGRVSGNNQPSPWADPADQKLIVHCCYHKAGTHWMKGILKRICDRYEMSWDRVRHDELFEDGPKAIATEQLNKNVLIDGHSRIDLSELRSYRGSHMIRDPRDMTISGYFYHLWSSEKWLHVSKPRFGNQTYQQKLNALDQEQGLILEVERFAGSFRRMIEWDYQNPNVFELRYEELLTDDGPIYRKLFEHYGFHEKAVQRALKIARKCSFEARARRKVGIVQENSVMRSGAAGQWAEYFTKPVKDRFKQLAGDVLIELGYEKNNDW